MRLEEVTYDFERDEWVAHRLIQARWIDRELPPPQVAPTKGIWHGRRSRSFDRRSMRSVIRVLAVIAAGFLLHAAWNGLTTELLLSVFVLSVVLPLATYFVWELPSRNQASLRDRRLMEDPKDLDVCLVEITIYHNGLATGTDRGVVWFEGGRLLFCGHGTSFAVGGEDVLPRRLWDREDKLNRELILRLRYSADVLVEFRPLRSSSILVDHKERFVERFNAFRTRPPQSRGPRQWPPFE